MTPTVREVPKVLLDAAMLLAIVINELGLSDQTIEITDRGGKFLDQSLAKDAAAALGDDLDAMSVVVGFSAAMGAIASCLGANDSMGSTDVNELLKQIRKAKDN